LALIPFFRSDRRNIADLLSQTDIVDENWHLFELHRDSSNNFTILIDGVDTGFSQNDVDAFAIGYWLSTFKGASNSIGRMMSFYIYDRSLANNERTNIRKWVYMRYKVGAISDVQLTVKYKYVEIDLLEPGESSILANYGSFTNCQNDCVRTLPYGLSLDLDYDNSGDYDISTSTCDNILMDGDKSCTLILQLKLNSVPVSPLTNVILNPNL
jgi:hypothetical protein